MKVSTIWDRHPILQKLAVAALWLLVWQGAYRVVGQDLLLVSPAAAAARLITLAGTANFWVTIAGSLGRILSGFLLGLFSGTLFAAATAHSRWAYAIVSLPMNLVKATPVASFVILALVWISGKNLSVFIAFLMVLPVIWTNMHQGFRACDPKLCEMAQVFCLPRKAVLRAIILPAAAPYFLSAMRVGVGFAWKAGIAGEVIAIPSAAIGTALYNAKIYLETADLFAWTAVVILLSVLLEKVLVHAFDAASKRMSRLRQEEGTGCG